MSRKDDLENSITESYAIIREYEAILRTSDRPEEKARARRVMRQQHALIEGHLGEYTPGQVEGIDHHQAAGQAEPIGRLGKMSKHFLNNIFRRVQIARQYDGQLEQLLMILVIDSSQGVAAAPLKFPDKQLIFHYPITHQKWEFYI